MEPNPVNPVYPVNYSQTISAGATRVPGAFGRGCTSTLPLSTFTLKVGIFSVNGGGETPESGRY